MSRDRAAIDTLLVSARSVVEDKRGGFRRIRWGRTTRTTEDKDGNIRLKELAPITSTSGNHHSQSSTTMHNKTPCTILNLTFI